MCLFACSHTFFDLCSLFFLLFLITPLDRRESKQIDLRCSDNIEKGNSVEESLIMLSSQSKKPSPGFRPATPDLAHAKDTSTSLLERTRKEVLVTPITDLDCSVLNAVATVHLGSVGTFSHEGIVTLVSNIAESNDKSALATMNQPHHIASNSPEVEKKALPALTPSIQPPWLNIFSQNVAPPALSTSLPPPGSRFEDTAHLAYCVNLLRKYPSPSSSATSTSKESLDSIQRALIESYAQKEDEMDRLIQRVLC
ncbi:MAG: hypothetical protein J3R72DRAFT_471384 [Linnemannia gamsii]|nr:MAG: hypothetical protein J3R72DRAFT_471384 [Linnemannia gamsii]